MDHLSSDALSASRERPPWPAAVAVLLAASALVACSPTVRVEAPEDPIEINLNVRIEQEVRIRVDRELDRVYEENDDIF